MKEHGAEFRFYADLNDFLPVSRRKTTIVYAFNGHPAVKDPIEVLGVPHTEVDLIVVNGNSVDFAHPLQAGDRVAVYPGFANLDISPLVKLRDAPPRPTAFVADVHLGKLARLLRLLGLDVLYRNDYTDDEIIQLALAEQRIILTRDRRLLHHRVVTHGHCLHSTDPIEQARAVLARFDLVEKVRCFRRCSACNAFVQPVAKEEVLDYLEPLTRQYYHEFYRCERCRKIYWQGTHYASLVHKIETITGP